MSPFLPGLVIGALIGWIVAEMWRELRADAHARTIADDAVLPPPHVIRARVRRVCVTGRHDAVGGNMLTLEQLRAIAPELFDGAA